MEINSISDAEATLVRRLRERDQLALGELYDQYGRLVYGLGIRILRDASAAEDLTQETFLYIWNRIESFDATRGSLMRWITLVARSRILDYVRSSEFRAARKCAPLEAAEQRPDRFAVPDATSHSERVQVLKEPWKKLKQHQREVLRLAFYSGLSHPEIARQLNRPLGTIKTWIRSALQSMRADLEAVNAR
jgi:RNA polymerase sigma-70 factor (ECF subfamily)